MIAVDLFSDTVTRPTPAMRRAMAEAEVGDEQLQEDPTVNRLQDAVAELLGKEAALFLPSGTMCNQVAFAVHCRPGDEILLHELAHPLLYEAGGRGRDDRRRVPAARRDPAASSPRTRCARPPGRRCTTCPAPGWSRWSRRRTSWAACAGRLDEIEAVCGAARGLGLACHMDGARLFNAVVATGTPARAFAAPFDSVWVDLTKGLGAPVGAVLAGSRGFVDGGLALQAAVRRRDAPGRHHRGGRDSTRWSTTSSASPTTTSAPAGWPAGSRSCRASRWTRTGSRPTSSSSTSSAAGVTARGVRRAGAGAAAACASA